VPEPDGRLVDLVLTGLPANLSIPEAPIGFDESTPPDGFTGKSPVISVAPLSVILQPSPGPAMSCPSSHIGSYHEKGT
jgi:hypothetical protein